MIIFTIVKIKNKQAFKKILTLHSYCLCLHLKDQQTLLNTLEIYPTAIKWTRHSVLRYSHLSLSTFSTTLDLNLLWNLAAATLTFCLPHIYCSVAKLCSTLYDPMDGSTSGSSALHYLLEFAQIHVH